MSNGIMMISCTNGRSYYEGNEGLTAMESDRKLKMVPKLSSKNSP